MDNLNLLDDSIVCITNSRQYKNFKCYRDIEGKIYRFRDLDHIDYYIKDYDNIEENSTIELFECKENTTKPINKQLYKLYKLDPDLININFKKLNVIKIKIIRIINFGTIAYIDEENEVMYKTNVNYGYAKIENVNF